MRTRRAQAGFTMIEVMIAVLLTAIATSGIIGLFMVQSRASGFSRHQTEATVLAQDQLERLRTVPTTVSGADASPLDAAGKPGGIYTRSWTFATGATPTYYDIAVTVAWDEDNSAKTVVIRGRRNM